MLQSFLQIDFRKGILGILMGLAVFAASCVLSAPLSGLALAAGFVVFGFLRITACSKTVKHALCILWTAAILTATWYTTLTSINSVVWLQTTQRLFNLNALCMLILYGILFLITANWNAAVTAGSTALALLAMANGFIYQFRGKELLSSDVLSFSTALSVADQYSATVTPMMFFGWALWGLVLFSQFSFPMVRVSDRPRTRAFSLVALVSSVVILFSSAANVQTELWDTRGSVVNGYYLNFLLSIRDSTVQKPQGYDPSSFPQESTPTEPCQSRPNVIVIMNEAFSDLRVFGDALNTNIPVLPFFDSLKQESIHGYALSSVFGGNTPNSEFEFLTGHTMAFLPAASVAYQQFVHGEIFILPRLMNAYGYQSIATHPYGENGWSRRSLYPSFGFSESTFINDYPQKNLLRTYVSDQEMYEFMLQKLAAKTEAPLFLFAVSMQNHGGYSYSGEDFVKTVSLTDYPEQFPLAEQYLSSMHASDSALEYLITNLRNYPEDTVVLLFGDHLPRLDPSLFELLTGSPFDTLEEQMKQYSVPFFIWANYDLQPQELPLTSLNYLSGHLLNAAGLPLSPYHQKLQELEAVIPAVNSLGYFSAAQNRYLPISEARQQDAEALNTLASLQYNNLFDPFHRSNPLFGQYLPK